MPTNPRRLHKQRLSIGSLINQLVGSGKSVIANCLRIIEGAIQAIDTQLQTVEDRLTDLEGEFGALPPTRVFVRHIVLVDANTVIPSPTLNAYEVLILILEQDATGFRTVTWPASFAFDTVQPYPIPGGLSTFVVERVPGSFDGYRLVMMPRFTT